MHGTIKGYNIGKKQAKARNHATRLANKGRMYPCREGNCAVRCSSPEQLHAHWFARHKPQRTVTPEQAIELGLIGIAMALV